MANPLVTIVLGTRPEAIKLAPVIRAFQQAADFRTRVVLTGQHREMVSQVMDLFGFAADCDLALMAPKQTLTHVTCGALAGLEREFADHRPELVLVQGDTSTAFASALAAFYAQIPVGHVEAGLRTDNLFDPFPEEANRRLISQLALLHFAPTPVAAANCRASGVIGEVLTTGNTVIDALLLMAGQAPAYALPGLDWQRQRVILATVHRRENWGERLSAIGNGFLELLERFPDSVSYSCTNDIPCETVWVWKFHFLSIPGMAWVGFALLATLSILARPRSGSGTGDTVSELSTSEEVPQ